MDQLAAQWPMLAALAAITGSLLKVIQGLYERIIKDLTEDRDRYRDIAFSFTHIAEGALDKVEEQTSKRRS